MKQISTSLTSKLRTDSITERDYIIFSGETTKHYIWFNLYDDCYNNGNFIGTFVMKRVEFTYKDSDLEFKQKEFNAYKEYKLDNGTWESINYGTFIVQAVEESDTKEEIKVTAYDYTLKFANTYVSELDYSSGTITLLQVLQECCTKCGVELATNDFANSDFLVDSNQFDGLSMFGNVVSAVAGISCNFAKIKADNKLYLEFKNETGIIVDVSDYEEFDDKRDTRPYNAVSLGMSGVEGENVTLVDEGVEPGKEKYLTINDNPFAYNQEKRNELIQAIFDKVNGFGYSSFELNNCMYPQLECGDLIQIKNKEGQLVDTIVLRISYEETKIKLEAPSTISATVTYQNPPSSYDIAKLTQITVDKQNQTITGIIVNIDENGEQISQVQNSVEGLNISITDIENDVHNLSTNLSITAEGLEAKINKSGNNLLYGTALYDLSQWGWQPTAVYIEQATPPSLDAPYDWWYCTQDNGEYVNGTVYSNDRTKWVGTDYTRKELIEGYQTNHIYILENEFTKSNFLSQRALNFTQYTDESVGLVADAYTSTKQTTINSNMGNLVFSCKVQNNLQYGYLHIAFTENVNEIINSSNQNDIIYAIQKDLLRSYNSDLEEIEFTFPILTQKDVVTGYYGETEPTNQTYWFDTTNNVLKTKDSEGNWTIVGNKIFGNNGTYYGPVVNNENIFYIEKSLPSLNAKSIYGTLYTCPIALGFSDGYSIISETEPEPKKGLYWAKPSVDAIYYAKYNTDGTFDEWELLPYTYQDAVDNTQYYMDGEYPTIPVTGNVLIGDIKLEYGTSATDWSLNENESYGQYYKLDDKGLQMQKGNYKMYIDEDEITGYYKEEIAFSLNEYRTFSKIGQFEETNQNGLITKKLSNGVYVRYIE